MIGEDLVSEFTRCLPWIESALAAETSTLSRSRDVLDFLRTGQCKLWSDTRACIVTYIDVKPRGKVLVMWLGGGDLDAILALGEKLQPHAIEHGCSKVEIHGRPGWVKALKARGFRPVRVTLAIDVPETTHER